MKRGMGSRHDTTDLVALARRALRARVDEWFTEGTIHDVPVSYTIQKGVMTFRKNGKVKAIAPKDERLIASRFCPEHLAFLNVLDRCVTAIERDAPIDAAAGEALAAIAHPRVVAALEARGITLSARPDADALRSAANDGDLDGLRAQLAAGVDVDAANDEGWTALLVAARAGFADGVVALLRAGADANATLREGFNALHLVIEHAEEQPTDGDSVRIAEALIAAGIDVDRATSRGQTPVSTRRSARSRSCGASSRPGAFASTRRTTIA